jgi:Nucleotidyltransferase of unknown function (DUF6036)
MDIPSLKHLVSAIRQHAATQRLIVFGSGSLLASFAELGVEDSLVRKSRDADFLMFPWDEDLAHLIHSQIGADFPFDHEFGYYADIVRPIASENFPPGWEDRLIPLDGVPNVFCLEPHDMAVAKLFAGRPKDIALLTDLMKSQRLDALRIYRLLFDTPMAEAMIVKTHSRLKQAADAAGVALPR